MLPCVVCRAGLLGNIPSAELRQKLDAPAGVEELVQLSEKFVSDVRVGRHAQEGWPNSMYGEHTGQHPSRFNMRTAGGGNSI